MGAQAVAAAQTLALPGCSGLAAYQPPPPAKNSSGLSPPAEELGHVPDAVGHRQGQRGPRCSREMRGCPCNLGDAGGAARVIPSLHVLWAGNILLEPLDQA